MIRLLATVLLTAALTQNAAAEDKVLRVCFGEYDAPRADKDSGRGFDVEVMRAVAARLGARLEPVWTEQEKRMTEAEDSDLPLPQLSQGECDAVASVPGSDSLRGVKGNLALTRPYYGAGFEFVARTGGPRDFSQMQGRRIVIQYMSVGHLAAEAARLDWIGATTPEGQIAELQAGRADAALIWGPALGTMKDRLKDIWPPTAIPPESLRWNEHVATRESDRELGKAIDAALGEMLASGEIGRILQAHGVPAHDPFDRVFTQTSLMSLQLRR
ncbi:MAG: substrate-binding periplasmic protein [Pseudomonadota bacterium]